MSTLGRGFVFIPTQVVKPPVKRSQHNYRTSCKMNRRPWTFIKANAELVTNSSCGIYNEYSCYVGGFCVSRFVVYELAVRFRGD